MPAYKDKKRGTWYCQFYYTDWMGVKKQKRKRGFAKQGDAKKWEREFLDKMSKTSDIAFPSLVENYLSDLETRLKITSLENKRSIFNSKILPFFQNFKACDIEELDVRRWHNELLLYKDEKGEPYKDTYLRTIHNQLSAIMNYAVVYYHLPRNPCKTAGSIGKQDADAMEIWTLDQFERFIECADKPAGHLAYNILFWSGIREGELLALEPGDFMQIGDDYYINVNKNFQVVKGVEYILTPKQPASIRKVAIPKFLYYEAMDYISKLYGNAPDDRIFYFKKSYLLSEIKRIARLAGLDPVRVHDLRHSHASLLIELGFNILMVSQRLGHENVETTWRTYAHLYPDKDSILASRLDTVKINGITGNESVESQLLGLLQQFQNHLNEQPALVDISNEEIFCWDPEHKEKVVVSQEEFEEAAEVAEDTEAALAVTEIFQAGYMEICGLVYCLASRGLPAKYL